MRYPQMLSARLLAIIPLLAVIAVTGCTTFNHEWKAAARETPAADDLQGRWQGIWVSEADGHTDQLRCIVTKKGESDYRARFHAKYRKIFSFGYTVPLRVERADGAFKFSGDANLGWYAGGVYHYEGHAGATNFFSTYSCKYDHGTFQMHRP